MRIEPGTRFCFACGSTAVAFDTATDAKLKQAYLLGWPCARFQVQRDGVAREHLFCFLTGAMSMTDLSTGDCWRMWPAWGLIPAESPVLPQGHFMILTLSEEQAGRRSVSVPHPWEPARRLDVDLPRRARAGQRIAVPLPARGEKVEDVIARQQQLRSRSPRLAGLVGLARRAVALQAAVLGEHLHGGTLHELDDALRELEPAQAAGKLLARPAAGDFSAEVVQWLGGPGAAEPWIGQTRADVTPADAPVDLVEDSHLN